jgi:hypothetical protein
MFGKLFASQRTKKDIAMCNVSIRRDSDNLSAPYFHGSAAQQFIGEHTLHDTGRLARGTTGGLHTYVTGIGGCDDHIHLGADCEIFDIDIKGKALFLKGKIERNPRFTLRGFYVSTGLFASDDNDKKEPSLLKEIRKHNPNYRFDSIATRGDTRVKLLENAYKRFVSGQ